MSGTGPTPAEQHLGDRLAALVDGELGHDARERVLAHLATCCKCKAEADAQRRLKSVFAQAAPPPPSEGLLARLQGLPGGAGPGRPGGDDDRGGPFGQGRLKDGAFGGRPDAFRYAGAPVLPGGPESGFRIHEVSRPGTERSTWRGRRFAFAAASAVSFAAIALGGALPAAVTVDARGEGTGNSVTPLRSPGQSQGGTDNSRRRGGNGTSGATRSPERPAPPLTAPPAAVPVHAAPQPGLGAHPFLSATPLGMVSPLHITPPAPLIRPTGTALHLATATATGPALTATPSPSSLPLTARR
ncbi:zf-HC2 domain-containing protein [Streptomyces ficellus]|uniref:Zf-HC2 domain-containing protein n=1 Tax=Streptomyces ficellus TaxID=1977088 RepID=A0ABT7Z528_9ACTN|nr:zf-HC2 domain-containing protein [Streptomyces ficellus]MDN3294592.1 zf-HC2 domain-containing protein [Streptomyces ficellus]